MPDSLCFDLTDPDGNPTIWDLNAEPRGSVGRFAADVDIQAGRAPAAMIPRQEQRPWGEARIRPTSTSSDEEKLRYAEVTAAICDTALRDLLSTGRFRSGDILKITPVDGCFHGTPPKPRVTLSEVLAAVVSADALERWQRESSLREQVALIREKIRYHSRMHRLLRDFRTYILVYVAGPQGSPENSSRKNRLIAADFDSKIRPMRTLAEFIERRNLLKHLRIHFKAEMVKAAILLSGDELSNRSDLKVLAEEFMSAVKASSQRFSPANFVILFGMTALVTLLGSLIALPFVWGHAETLRFAVASGASAGVALMLAGEWASVLLSQTDAPDR